MDSKQDPLPTVSPTLTVMSVPTKGEWFLITFMYFIFAFGFSSITNKLMQCLPLIFVICSLVFGFFQQYEIIETTLFYQPLIRKLFKLAPIKVDLTQPFHISRWSEGFSTKNTDDGTTAIDSSQSYMIFDQSGKKVASVAGRVAVQLIPTLQNYPGYRAG